ncbi:MAG: transporter [Candidatus Cloacimonetes bacterium]|nr:transporter [Candidatus Cloacimonadota bacterium]
MKINRYLLLFFGYLLYSLVAVVAKYSAIYPFFSLASLTSYAIVLSMLVLYAFIWQISLQSFSLSLAYMCRGSLVILAMFWSKVIFKESITTRNLVGAGFVIIGIILFTGNQEQAL